MRTGILPLGVSGCLAIAVAAVTAARADVNLYEPFNYDPAVVTQLKNQAPDGIRTWNVAGAGAGDASTGLPHPAPGNLPVPDALAPATGNLLLFGGTGEGTRINVSTDGTTLTAAGTTLYYSLAIRVDSVTHLTATGQILTCFTQYLGGGTGAQTSLGAVLWVKPGSDANHYKFGLSPNANSARVVWDDAHDFANGSTQYLVAADTQPTSGVNADDVSRLWVNPTSLGGAEPAPNITTTIHDFDPTATSGDMNFFGSFEIRRLPSGTTDYPDVNSVALDELRLGTTYASVTPLAGDFNADGAVNAADLALLDNGLANHLTGYANGDLNSDGTINADDYALFDRALARFTQPAPGAPTLPTVPEPALATPLILLTTAVRRRR